MEEVPHLLRIHLQEGPQEVCTLTLYSGEKCLAFLLISPPLPSVMALSTPRYCTGDVITMQLMVREKVGGGGGGEEEGDRDSLELSVSLQGTTRAIPRPEWAGALCGVPSLAGGEATGRGCGQPLAYLSAPLLPSGSGNFAKLLTATPSQVLWHIVQPERAALTAQLGSLTKEEVGVASLEVWQGHHVLPCRHLNSVLLSWHWRS